MVDVGANFGYYSVIASHLVGPSGRVLAFEPSPETGQILSANIKRLENIEHISMAVSDISGSINFFHTSDFVNSGTVQDPPFQDRENVHRMEVKATTLDDFFDKGEQIDFLKIDIQGDDIKALMGAKKLSQRSNDIKVLVEWAPTWMGNAGYEADDLPRCLNELGLEDIRFLDDWLEEDVGIEEFRHVLATDASGKRFANIFAQKSKT